MIPERLEDCIKDSLVSRFGENDVDVVLKTSHLNLSRWRRVIMKRLDRNLPFNRRRLWTVGFWRSLRSSRRRRKVGIVAERLECLGDVTQYEVRLFPSV